MSPPRHHSTARYTSRWLAALFLLAGVAQGHSTITIDQTPASFLTGLKGDGQNAGPIIAHSLAVVRLRDDRTEIDVTIADSAAYQLLEHDPYVAPPAPAAASGNLTGGIDPHFTQDQPLLTQRGATLYALSSSGTALPPPTVNVELTKTQDIIFHLTYPHLAPGPLRLEALYTSQVPTGQAILAQVLDQNRSVIAYAVLNKDNPALDTTVPVPGAASPAADAPTRGASKGMQLLALAAGTAGALGLFWLLGRLRRTQPADERPTPETD